VTFTSAILATLLLPLGFFSHLSGLIIKPASTPPPKPKIILTTASEPVYDITFEVISTPTATVTPTPTVKPTSSPTPKPTSPPPPLTSGSSVQDYLMQEINNYRRSQGLSEVKTDSYTCDFAAIRAQEISSAFNHDGFSNRLSSKTLPYPSYSVVIENLAKISDYQKVVTLWINSSGHAANMRKDTPFVCVAQNGNFFAYEGFKP